MESANKAKLQDRMLAIQNIHPSDRVKGELVARGYDSSVRIYQKPESEFIRDVQDIMTPEEAERAYARARRNYMTLTHLTAALNVTYGSDATRALNKRFAGEEVPKGRLFENIPSYQEIFGNLDYCNCPQCKSIFGPAAYFVDLMRIIRKHILLEEGEGTREKAVPLEERRGDLFQLILSCENTNAVKPYLEIVNGILEDFLQKGGGEDLYQKLSSLYYPAPLPFHLPMETLRVWLSQAGACFAGVLEAWGFPKEAAAAENLGVTPELFALLQKPLDTEALCLFLGEDTLQIEDYRSLPYLLQKLGITRLELQNALQQDIGEEEPEREKLLHGFFINQCLPDAVYLSILVEIEEKVIEGKVKQVRKETVEHLTEASLERLCRFLRLQSLLGISCAELDWILKAAGTDGQGRVPLADVCRLAAFARSASLDIYTAAAFAEKLKDYGSNPFFEVFGRTRAELEAFTEPGELERLFAQKLGCDVGGLRALRQYLGERADADAVYRHCNAARLLSIPLEEYVLLLRMAFAEPVVVFADGQLENLLSMRAGSRFSVWELNYLVRLTPSPYAKPGFTLEAFHQKVELMRKAATEECREDKENLCSYVEAELSEFFGQTPAAFHTLLGCVLTEEELEGFPSLVMGCAAPEKLDEAVHRLSRYLMLTQAGISAELLAAAVRYPESFGLTDANRPSLQTILDIEAYQNFIVMFQDEDNKLLQFLSDYSQDSGATGALAEATGWSGEEISLVMKTRYPGKPEKNVTALIRVLASCLELLKKLSLDETGLSKLLSCAHNESENYDTVRQTVEALCAPTMNADLRGILEGRKRDALLELAFLKLRESFDDITDYNKLYKYFLIDVEMDSKTLISPVKEGINALQLYLQRCRMRLERGIKKITIPDSWWSWMMDYQLWEANRKVFVYPENYLLPSVRQSKTHLFQNVEDALQQSKITNGYIEEQYVKYLDEYFELTQLKICGAYETVENYLNVLYVFARTQKQPYTYYYCKQVSTLAWSEWEKVDTNIDTDVITPVYVFNRLHIFWSVLQENTKVKVEGSNELNAGNQKAYNLQIKYTYLNLQGKWITPQTLSENVVVYAEDDKAASREMREKAGVLGVTAPDDSFKKLTLLRLNQGNLDGFMKKGEDYECLAVIAGSFTQNLGEELARLKEDSSLDREQEAFSKALNRMIRNSNYEMCSYEDGYFSTGYFKIFNEDLEEEHFLHANEFIVVDGYIQPKNSLMYTELHDEIHRAVGVYLSQSILRDAALPKKGILPFENNAPSSSPPKLEEKSFVLYDTKGEIIISPALSKEIYNQLCLEDIIDSEGHADEKQLRNRDLLSLLNDLLIDSAGVGQQLAAIQDVRKKAAEGVRLTPHSFAVKAKTGKPLISPALSEKITRLLDGANTGEEETDRRLRSLLYEENGAAKRNNQILEIERILLKNIGAVYLFKKADKAQVLPVVNQPGKFIYDCGDEAFLVYPVYPDEKKYYPVNIQKTDAGVTVGVPVTAGAFVKLGFDPQKARQILEALNKKTDGENALLNGNGIVNRDVCTREKLERVLAYVIAGEQKQELLDQIYAMLLNLPMITKAELENITGVTPEEICSKLQGDKEKVLYSWMGDPSRYRIDLSVLEKKNDVLFTNSQGGVLKEQSVSQIYKRLQGAVSSVNFNYRINADLPRQFTGRPFREWQFAVQRLTNPTIKKLKRKLETGGVSSFLNRQTQSEPAEPIMPFDRLGPTGNVLPPKARDGAQVDFEGLYAEYNWELFYHIPMLIAENLGANAMHEDGMRWHHYVFDPTKPHDDAIPKYYWNFVPFAESDEETLETMLKNPTAIQAYNDSPFNPHAIARLRIDAYGKYTVMEYVNNIIRWGDSQFVRNTWESLTTATMMYVMASDLLGPKPQQVGNFQRKEDKSFADIEAFYEKDPQGIPQFIIELEKKVQLLQSDQDLLPCSEEVPFNDIRAFFGVPENEQLLLLWDIVDDRLYKLRNSLDINGAPRTTALFEPPLDPANLVRAFASSGADSPAALIKKGGLHPYRFSYMIEQAKNLTAQLISLGNSILSALEKSDAEALLLLTGGQEQILLDMTTAIRESQLQEIASGVESLKISRESAEIRRDYYAQNAAEYMSSKELASFVSDDVAAAFQAVGGSMRFASGVAHLAPQVGSPFAMKYGGAEIGASLAGAAAGFETLAGIASHASRQILTMAQYDRRRDEWELQKKQAEKELENLDKQLEASRIRQESARRELEIHKKTMEQKKEVMDYLKKKFTGGQLYQWIAGRLTSTMWQTYRLALELGFAAQEAYEYERDEAANFIKFDYWDSGRKGLLSGECLMLALEQMQQSYLKKNERRLEIETNISLLHECPQALDQLKSGGGCRFELGERLFARDYPGCYRRKIKSISLSVPAVLPPYETLKATLKQVSSSILLKADEKGIDYLFHLTQEPPPADVVRQACRHGEKIAVSRGIDDSGMFTLSFSDERYLPFEGTGVASVWSLEMPPENNRFNLQTISDVIVTVRYTAQEDERRGPGSFYESVTARLAQEADVI